MSGEVLLPAQTVAAAADEWIKSPRIMAALDAYANLFGDLEQFVARAFGSIETLPKPISGWIHVSQVVSEIIDRIREGRIIIDTSIRQKFKDFFDPRSALNAKIASTEEGIEEAEPEVGNASKCSSLATLRVQIGDRGQYVGRPSTHQIQSKSSESFVLDETQLKDTVACLLRSRRARAALEAMVLGFGGAHHFRIRAFGTYGAPPSNLGGIRFLQVVFELIRLVRSGSVILEPSLRKEFPSFYRDYIDVTMSEIDRIGA
jgi:hypothetical protein